MLSFNWDEDKNNANIAKHVVSFKEAHSVFYDESAIEFFDDSHSNAEDRYILLGFSNHLRLLVVCHCLRKNDSVIRLILKRAREAEPTSWFRFRCE